MDTTKIILTLILAVYILYSCLQVWNMAMELDERDLQTRKDMIKDKL